MGVWPTGLGSRHEWNQELKEGNDASPPHGWVVLGCSMSCEVVN
jgi:hypothetical protein